uniref:Probable membrane transporter protein n=1 Tax=Candidatus Kentrum sp. MB TaxID=2138164 RepID=A0A450X9K2_9GAMM|nr:MAG: hypothetical protein BECKMB1821G_GA0114241_10175 [Candidatus Kentron sp. MB]VFK33804.1 MAG: hypothetical protein BECKMB1821I_GA0114274_105327 [Candidatus Kentron sp. MB]VFK76392.1 MAG: hypothetical protein BECKMB1821H_GA0114242_105427 [Candidatus Kentron sp. MB]
MVVVVGLLVGLSKTGIPAAGLAIVPIMALFFPARLSVGALLPILIIGDILAIKYYRHHANYRELSRLAPGCLLGMIVGAFLISGMDDATMERALGALILLLLALEGLRVILPGMSTNHREFPWIFGTLVGAATMGNAAGPIISLYLLRRALPKEALMGTAAWFFLIVNSLKVPLFVYLGIITRETLLFDVMLLPMVLLGGWLGVAVLFRISQSFFNTLLLLLSAVIGLQLIIGL